MTRALLLRQRGLTLLGLIIVLFVLVVLALGVMKLLPAYIEYGTAKKAIGAIARERNAGTPQEVRRAFDARAQIDGIEAVKGSDLDVSKQGNEMVIGFAYRKEIPLVANVGVYIDFSASTREQ